MGGSGGNGDSTSKDFTTEDVEKEMRKSSFPQKQDYGQKSLGIGAYTVNRKGQGSPFPLCLLLHFSKHVM